MSFVQQIVEWAKNLSKKKTTCEKQQRFEQKNHRVETVKVLLVGGEKVGKSEFLASCLGEKTDGVYKQTIGVDFRISQFDKTKYVTVKAQIWDTAGAEQFKTITTSYYRGADAVILVCDLTSLNSLCNLRNAIGDVQRYARDDIKIVLVGTKKDLVDKREITKEQMTSFSEEFGFKYIETSSRDTIENTKYLMDIVCSVEKVNNVITGREPQKDA